MNMSWLQNANRSEARTEDTGEDQLSLIPRWSVVLAVAVFAAVQYLFHGVMPHHKHEMLPMRLLMGYSWGTAFAKLCADPGRSVMLLRLEANLG